MHASPSTSIQQTNSAPLPFQDPVENMIGAVDSFWGHSLVPHELYDEWSAKCRHYTGDPRKDVGVLYSPV